MVAYCGESMGGSFVYSLVAREQSLVVAGLEAIAKRLPFPVLGIDSDNDSVFINDTLTQYCADRGIEFTCSRAYRKNDQAWIEQKSGAVIQRFLGHDRYSGQVAGQTIAHLHAAMRLHVNYFQPSFKLVEKTRNGSAVIKRYSPPATPCERVMRHEAVRTKAKSRLSERRPHWTRWRCCTSFGKPSQYWRPSCPRSSGPLLVVRVSSSAWPNCPTDGGRMKRVHRNRRRSGRHAPGEHGKTLLRACGATSWGGCRKTRSQHCYIAGQVAVS